MKGIPRCLASRFPNYSLPLEGGGSGRGCLMKIISTPSPQSPPLKGGDCIRYLAALL
jgi:hypothetical protein